MSGRAGTGPWGRERPPAVSLPSGTTSTAQKNFWNTAGVCVDIYICRGGQGLARGEERGHLVTPEAAVHRHTLDRVNAINDSFLIKKKEQPLGVNGHQGSLRTVARPLDEQVRWPEAARVQ